ncbi:MAG TPA: ABC transporter permease subunit [Streptosporangiaceae bacterium]|nr:ABC transporter permease subunit [Streptosporangiaceae bacterium]
MAVSPTFPSRENLGRLRFRPLDIAVGLGVLLLVYLVVRVAASAEVPFHPASSTTINTSPSQLPYYAARSLLRMFIALLFSFAFSLSYAYLAARNRRARRVLIPALDILQSVPVLGFLAVTVTFFTQVVFPGTELGLEAAAIFAVFTSQAWNITFSFYYSLISQPGDFDEASRLMGLSRWKRFWAIDVPGGAIGLVWNGMMSFGGSWFFLTASELITIGSRHYTLPGVGSYVGVAEQEGNLVHVWYGILTMIIMILLVNLFFWRPLVAYVEKFRVEQTESGQKPKSLVLSALRRSNWPAAVGRGKRALANPVNRVLGGLTGVDDRSLTMHAARRRAGDVAFTVVVAVALGYGLFSMLKFVAGGEEGLAVFGHAFWLGFLTLLRVIVVVVVSSAIWVPIGVWIGFNPKVAQFMQPVVQVLASFPANFVFPFAIAVFIDLGISLNYGAILLMMLGTQWYVLFNVIAGASAVPSDLKDAMDDLNVQGRDRWRRLILPGIFPAYVTGAITAAGGAWNATIVAEYVTYQHHVLVAAGLGSFIAQNTGNLPNLFAGLLVMAVFVTGINALVWRRMYRLAETKFALA